MDSSDSHGASGFGTETRPLECILRQSAKDRKPKESCLVEYAVDIAALVTACIVNQVQIKLNSVMRAVSNWMHSQS